MRIGLLIAALVGCAEPTAPTVSRPSVLLVTLDTTRADHLGAYGDPDAQTPTLDGLADRGAVWTRAYTVQPLTIPSHSSILTGRVPPSTGVRDNGDFALGDDAVTLAERFRDAGYRTAAITSAFPTHRRWGFAQGFDVYHDPMPHRPTQRDWRDQRRADEVVDDAIATLDDLSGPVFAWVHLFDPHWPYDPPPPFDEAFADRPYDGEIAFADAQLARLLSWWEARHPGGVIAVTADHGEALGDGGEHTHGFLLHDGTIRVPMILVGPGIAPGQRIADPVSTIDLAPTLLRLAGLPVGPEIQGVDLREGGTDLPYHEARAGLYTLGLAPLAGFTDADGRYVEGAYGAWYPVHGERVALEPAGGDLGALSDRLAALVAGFPPAEAAPATLDADALHMLTALGYLGGGDPTAPAGEVDPRDAIDAIPLTWQARRRIAQRLFTPAGELIDRLEEAMPGAWGVQQLRAQLALEQGLIDEAEVLYDDLFARAPTSTVALQLAHIATLRGDWERAAGWYQQALDLQPHSPEAMAGLVRALEAQGDLDAAQARASAFLVEVPDHAELVLLQAEMAILEGRYDRAVAPARRALEQMPWSAWAHMVLGQALWETGRPDPAIEQLEEAVRLQPFDARIRLRLADCLVEVGRHAEAVRILAPLAELFPDEPEVVDRYRTAADALQARRRPGTGYRTVLPPPPRQPDKDRTPDGGSP